MSAVSCRLLGLSLAASLVACTTLPQTGGVPPPISSTTTVESGSQSGRETHAEHETSGRSTTADERRAVFDDRLDRSLDQFDKLLHEEQRRTAEEHDARTAARQEAAEDSGSNDADSENGGREGDLRSERAVTNGSSGAEIESRRERGSPAPGSGSPDRGTPSGDDDDVVARRLRRAAEQETDSELKEKLWKEYLEYKRNVQGRG